MSDKRFMGKNARLYYNSATYETPTWVRIDTRNTLNIAKGKSVEDVSAEDSGDETWEQTVRKTRTLNFEAFFHGTEADNTVLEALNTAFENDTELEFAVARGDIATNGTVYRRLPGMYLQQADEGYDISAAAKLTCMAKPGPSDNVPSTVTVSS